MLFQPPAARLRNRARRATSALATITTSAAPVAPELDYWQITYAGYSHKEIYNDVDKTTDACIKTWAELRTDAIWMYVDISHQIDVFELLRRLNTDSGITVISVSHDRRPHHPP